MGRVYGCQDHASQSVRVQVGEVAKLDVRGKENVLFLTQKCGQFGQQMDYDLEIAADR